MHHVAKLASMLPIRCLCPATCMTVLVRGPLQGYIPRRITCTGFALGGALATIAACWAGATFPTADIRCYTFGSPRVGNRPFRNAYEALVGTSYRIVYEGDEATHTPKTISRYSHVGHVIWLTGSTIKYEVRFSATPV